jgi:acetolactate synthase-1/2/3 large subunit
MNSTTKSDKVAANETPSCLTKERSGAQIAVESIIDQGIKLIFGFPGGAVIPLYDELKAHENQLRHILVRHEQGAVHAATSYARVTGGPGVAVATSGPGASNLITGLMDALLDSTPIVVIGGQVSTSLIGNDAFQECDMIGMTNSVTKHNFQCRDANALADMIQQSFHIATTGKPGPVYIDLPKDVQTQKTRNGLAGPLDLPFYAPNKPVDPMAVGKAVNLIKTAKRPLLMLGQGVLHGNAEETLTTFANQHHIPVATTIMAKGAFDERNPLSVGCGGMHGRRIANHALSNCDVLITFGCRFSDRVTGDPNAFGEGKKIIHVDIDPYEIGKNVPVHVEMNCDANDAAEALSGALRGFRGNFEEWTRQIAHLREVCNHCVKEPSDGKLTPIHVMDALNSVLADDDVVTTGVGQHQMFASHYLYRRKPRTFVTSGGAGTMGFCLPASIGAALAKPDVNVWAVDGDGSFQMNVQELGTLASSEAKVIIVLVDNGYLGMVRQWQELFHGRRYSSVKLSDKNPDFVKLAEAYGIEGRFVNDESSLKAALAYARDAKHSVLVHVAVDPTSNIEPMIPPGGKLTDSFGHCIETPGSFFSKREMNGDTKATGGDK